MLAEHAGYAHWLAADPDGTIAGVRCSGATVTIDEAGTFDALDGSAYAPASQTVVDLARRTWTTRESP